MAAENPSRRSRLPKPQPSEDVTEPTVVRQPVGQYFVVSCAGAETTFSTYEQAIEARHDCDGTMRTEVRFF